MPTLAALIMGGAFSARAQTPAPVSPQQVTTTVPNLLGEILGKLLPTTTTVTMPTPTTAAAPPPSDSGSGGGDSSGDSGSSDASDGTVPASAQRVIDSVLRSGSSNTLDLLAAMKPLTDEGLTLEEAAVVGFGQFPVAGEAYWSDDWLTARFTPTFHLHQGNDIFAARGTPVRAPADGTVRFAYEDTGGQAAYLTTSDGTYYYMAHLDRFASDVHSGQSVKQGRVLGFVGTTGNADGGSPHCHFEIHPGGGAAVDPKATLDRWVREAIDAVAKVRGTFQSNIARPFTAAGILRRLDSGSLGGPTSSDGPMLWASSIQRDGTALRLTAAGGAAVTEGDAAYDPRVKGAQAQALDMLRAQQLAREVLAPLTPKVLADLLSSGAGG